MRRRKRAHLPKCPARRLESRRHTKVERHANHGSCCDAFQGGSFLSRIVLKLVDGIFSFVHCWSLLRFMMMCGCRAKGSVAVVASSGRQLCCVAAQGRRRPPSTSSHKGDNPGQTIGFSAFRCMWVAGGV